MTVLPMHVNPDVTHRLRTYADLEPLGETHGIELLSGAMLASPSRLDRLPPTPR